MDDECGKVSVSSVVIGSPSFDDDGGIRHTMPQRNFRLRPFLVRTRMHVTRPPSHRPDLLVTGPMPYSPRVYAKDPTLRTLVERVPALCVPTPSILAWIYCRSIVRVLAACPPPASTRPFHHPCVDLLQVYCERACPQSAQLQLVGQLTGKVVSRHEVQLHHATQQGHQGGGERAARGEAVAQG